VQPSDTPAPVDKAPAFGKEVTATIPGYWVYDHDIDRNRWSSFPYDIYPLHVKIPSITLDQPKPQNLSSIDTMDNPLTPPDSSSSSTVTDSTNQQSSKISRMPKITERLRKKLSERKASNSTSNTINTNNTNSTNGTGNGTGGTRVTPSSDIPGFHTVPINFTGNPNFGTAVKLYLVFDHRWGLRTISTQPYDIGVEYLTITMPPIKLPSNDVERAAVKRSAAAAKAAVKRSDAAAKADAKRAAAAVA